MHVTEDQLRQLAEDRLPAEVRVEVVRHLLTACRPCLELARKVWFPESEQEPDYSGVLRRLELAGVLALNDVEVERGVARELWDRHLARLAPGPRLMAIRNNPDLHTWGTFELLLTEAKRVEAEQPLESLDLAYAALAVADLQANVLSMTASLLTDLGELEKARASRKCLALSPHPRPLSHLPTPAPGRGAPPPKDLKRKSDGPPSPGGGVGGRWERGLGGEDSTRRDLSFAKAKLARMGRLEDRRGSGPAAGRAPRGLPRVGDDGAAAVVSEERIPGIVTRVAAPVDFQDRRSTIY